MSKFEEPKRLLKVLSEKLSTDVITLVDDYKFRETMGEINEVIRMLQNIKSMIREEYVTHTCEECGKIFHDTRKEARFCSKKCYAKFRDQKQNFHVCEFCGEEYKPSHIKQKFCSIECYAQAREKEYPKYTCDYCGDEFRARPSQRVMKHVFCSRSCSAKHMHEHVKKKKSRIQTFKCLWCGEEKTVELKPSQKDRQYCSVACSNKHYGVMKSGKNLQKQED